MKKIKISVCICFMFFLSFMFACCSITGAFSTHFAEFGVDHFSTEHSENSLCKYIWPSYGTYNEKYNDPILLYKYDSVDSNFVYTYDDEGVFYDERETVLSYIVYDSLTYETAKKELFDSTAISDIYKYKYNNYCFFLNLQVELDKGFTAEEVQNKEYEFNNSFSMICYNDDKNLLMSIGYIYFPSSLQAKKNNKSSLIYTDIGAFLKQYFYYYDFDAEIPKINADLLKSKYGKNFNKDLRVIKD